MSMTKQQIFDKVVNHLAQQKEPAMVNGSCMYRAPNGDKCAVGCLLPDKYYKKSMEGKLVSTLVEEYTVPKWFGKHMNLLDSLQVAHDESENLTSLKIFLRDIAEQHGLSATEVKKIKKWPTTKRRV